MLRPAASRLSVSGGVYRRRRLAVLLSSAFAAMAILPDANGQPSKPVASNPAQSPASASSDSVVSLDTITVSGQREIDPADEPYSSAGSGAYISGEQIERFRGTSVGDFLSGIPGVLNGDARNSGAVDVNIRGMQGQGRVPVLVDGATQETTIWQGYGGATPRSYIDPDFISSVGIEKGISSAADATGATGGLVRASTIGVKDILLPGRSYGIRLKGGFTTNSSPVPPVGTYGGWDRPVWMSHQNPQLPSEDTAFHSEGMRRPPLFKPTGGSGSAVFAASTDYLDFVAGYVRRKSGNFHAGGRGDTSAHLIAREDEYGALRAVNGGLSAYRTGEEVLNTSTDNRSWMLKATLKPALGHALELGFRQYKSAYGTAFATRIEASPYENPLSDITLDTYTIRYKWKPDNNDFIDLKIDAYQTAVDNRINTIDIGVRVERNELGELTYTPLISPWVEWIGSTRSGVTVSNTSRFANPAGTFKWEYGGAFVRENAGLPSGVDMKWFTETYDTGFPREGWRKETSGFTALEYKPVDRVTLNASTRYAHYKTFDKFGQGTIVSFPRQDSGWSAMGGVMVEPLDGLKIYTKYGKATRAPSIFESLTGPSFYMPVDQNPIKLERARNLEIGVNYLKDNAFATNDKLRLHAAYFDNHIDDYLTRVGISQARETLFGTFRNVEILGRTNLDYAKMRGFEASASYDTGRYYGRLAWSHYMAVMFCARKGVLLPEEPECRAGGLPHSYSLHQVPPRNTVTLNLGTRLLERKLDLGARANYIGSRFAPGYGRAIGMSGVRPSRWNPYTQLDVYASYRLSDRVTFDLAVDNLTDHYYMDALNAAQMPAPGRTIRGNVTVKF